MEDGLHAGRGSPPIRLLFADLDGTLIHYQDGMAPGTLRPTSEGLWGAEAAGSGLPPLSLVPLPPTSSGSQGFISVSVLERLAALRAQHGLRLVLISGARAGTMLARLPYLPAADAYVCESGGRIFYPAAAGWQVRTAAPLEEDWAWRSRHDSTAGPATAPPHSSGMLWELHSTLKAARHASLRFDAAGTTTTFRVRGPNAALGEVAAGLPGSLSCARNFGALDVYPATSGKVRAATHLAERWSMPLDHALFLCDDDNDMELAAVVRRAFLPCITSPSVRDAVDEDAGGRFFLAKAPVPWAVEEVLDAVQKEVGGG